MFVDWSEAVSSQEPLAMSESEEEVGLGLEFDTQSDSVSEVEEEETSAESNSVGKTVLEGANDAHLAQEEGGRQGKETD